MSPGPLFEIGRRRYAFAMAGYALAVAIIVAVLPLITPVDAQGRWFCFGLCGLFASIAGWRFIEARKSSPTEPVFFDPSAAPPEAQEKYFRRMLWVSAIAFPGLTAITAWELSRLESGEVEHVRLWAPLSALYEVEGFGPTVAAVPILGLLCMSVFTYKLKQLEDRRSRK